MAGKVVESLLRDKRFPWCLNEAYASGRRYCDGVHSPFAAFVYATDTSRIIIVLLLVGLLIVIGLLALGPVGWRLPLLGCAGAWMIAPSLFQKKSRRLKDTQADLEDFESELGELIRLLSWPSWGPVRPIHLMEVYEARARAGAIIEFRAFNVLQYELQSGLGCKAAESERLNLKINFDLFAKYRLVDAQQGYGPFYVVAKKKLDAESVSAVEAQLTPVAEA